MTSKIWVLFIIASLLNLHPVSAQNKELPFKLVEGNGGKPLGQINGIAQDPNGYIWLVSPGSKCLYRFDGTRMIQYVYDPANPQSLGGIDPEALFADQKGFIWIGLENGLDKLDPTTGIFRHFRHDDKDSGSINNNKVISILADRRGRIWVGTEDGLDRLDEKTNKFIHYRHDARNARSISSNIIRSIYEDHQGVIWFGTGFPFFEADPEDGGLNRLDTDGQFTVYKHDPNNPHSLGNNKVSAMFEDSRGVFWVGTGGDGLHTMNRITGSFERYLYDSTKPDKLSRPPRKKDHWHFVNEQVTFLTEDATGAIWIGSMWGGMNRYDTGSKKITNYDSSFGFPGRSTWTAANSRDGVLWIATEDQQLFRLDPFRRPVRNIFEDVPVSDILADKDGSIWASTLGKGLLHFDQHKQLMNHYTIDKIYNDPNKDTVNCLYSDGSDSIWLATKTQVSIFNKASGQLTDFSLNKKFGRHDLGNFFDIYQDKERDLWFATFEGVYRYHRIDGTIKRYQADAKDSGAISSDKIIRIVQDRTGAYWFGTWGGGINRLNLQTGKFQHYLPGYLVIYLYEDHEGVFWAGTVNGLFRFSEKENNFFPFFDAQSVMANVRILGIVEDDSNNLWISSEAGVVRLNAERNEKFIFGNKYGITDLFYASITSTANGELLFGSENGFYSFFPKELVSNRDMHILITSLSINNQIVLPDSIGVLKKPVEEISDLDLTYNQNNISFRFAAIDYRSPETVKYYTLLEGYDDVWREAIGEKSSYYFNVSPGKYTYRIRAANTDGVVGEKTLTILIHPPWWKTWWAYTLYGLLLLTAVYVFVRVQKQRVIRNERQRTQAKELAQAKEIQIAYTELKATQAQLIHAEKMASMGEMTAGIAHEIQNPLNFVNNFSEINAELIGDLKSDLLEGKTNDALSIINNVLDNENKILYHGKRADAIVKSMLQHSRKSSGQKEPTEINKLVDEYIRLAYHGLRAKDKSFNATIKTNFDEQLGKVKIVPQEIGRALLNLLNNAFFAVAEKAKSEIPEYHPTVEISTKKTDGRVDIRIKDNGNGIPQQVISKIFQPFFTTKQTGEGTGLGLSLSFDIITKGHGGELKVETEEGKYAAFTICLPAE